MSSALLAPGLPHLEQPDNNTGVVRVCRQEEGGGTVRRDSADQRDQNR